jgi:hypothetical protein
MIILCRQPFLQERTQRVQPTPDGDQTLPCPAARGNPILPLESKWSRLSDPVLCGRMATPIGATGRRCGLPVVRPEPRTLKSFVPAGFAECVDDKVVVEAHSRRDFRMADQLDGTRGVLCRRGEPIGQIDAARVSEDHIRFCHRWAVSCSQFDTKGSHHRSGDPE